MESKQQDPNTRIDTPYIEIQECNWNERQSNNIRKNSHLKDTEQTLERRKQDSRKFEEHYFWKEGKITIAKKQTGKQSEQKRKTINELLTHI